MLPHQYILAISNKHSVGQKLGIPRISYIMSLSWERTKIQHPKDISIDFVLLLCNYKVEKSEAEHSKAGSVRQFDSDESLRSATPGLCRKFLARGSLKLKERHRASGKGFSESRSPVASTVEDESKDLQTRWVSQVHEIVNQLCRP